MIKQIVSFITKSISVTLLIDFISFIISALVLLFTRHLMKLKLELKGQILKIGLQIYTLVEISF